MSAPSSKVEEPEGDAATPPEGAGATPPLTAVANALPQDRFHAKRSPLAYVMVDGEFDGPDYTRNSVRVWALIVFIKTWQCGPMGHEMVTRELGSICVRMKPAPDTAPSPATTAGFWARPENAELATWVEQDNMSQEEGAAKIHAFLTHYATMYDLRFISKPAGTDIGRLKYCLSAFGPEDAFVPHHHSICLLAQLHIVSTLLRPYGPHVFEGMLQHRRRIMNLPPVVPNHFPLVDCRIQIADFATCECVLVSMTQRLMATAPPPA